MASNLYIFLLTAALLAACSACGTTESVCGGSACYDPSSYVCAFDRGNGKNLVCPKVAPVACNNGCFAASYSCTGTFNAPSASLKSSSTTKAATSSTTKAATSSTTKAATSSSTKAATSSSTKAASSTSRATTSSSAPATSSPVVNNPTPSPNNYPTQTADLRIINSCKKTLWFEARYGGAGAPIPGQSATAVQALPGSYIDYNIPASGLGGTRFWAKYGCDSNGKNCLIGDQMQYYPNPPGGCPSGGCTPPVDSLFEATWGCKPGADCWKTNPTTWFDTSQVDGWTIPYKLTASGATNGCDCIGDKCGFSGVDASTLSLARCPTSEDLSLNGQYPTVQTNGVTASLKSVDLRIINKATNEVLGCMSPCKKLNWGFPYGLQQPEVSGPTMWMCCPTPTPADCSPSNGCVLPDTCRAGPIEKTQFVAAVHDMAPGVYSYSYDDGVGLHACPAGTVIYTMEFCPGGTSYPLQL